MREVVTSVERAAEQQPAEEARLSSLMTPLGVAEGEVLAYLEDRQSSTLRKLNRELRWPAYMVMMAVGALIRAGLVRGIQRDLDVTLSLRKPLPGLQ
jgi:hypothetical protein